MKIVDVIFNEELYPRFNFDEETVNQYRLNLDKLPPIVVSENNILIDGYHRLIAHKIEQCTEIDAEVLPITNEAEILKESIRLNASHGMQLTMEEKKKWARSFYERELEVKEIAELLSVDKSTVSRWAQDLKQVKDDEQRKLIMDLWFGCKPQNEIAKETGLTEGRISQILNNLQKSQIKDLGNNPPDSLKVFNLWNFGKSNDALKYPGQIPSQIMENLLWYYTKPFDVVYDPMAGGGTTIRVCQKMYRRWQASDIAPIINEIQEHDITTGFPDWLVKPDFIFLDPPYWDMNQGEYSNDDAHLANMSIDDYYQSIDDIAKNAKKVLRPGGHVAWIVSTSQKDDKWIDHAIKFFAIFEKYFMPVLRCDVPYTTQQYSGHDVDTAKRNKHILNLTRDLGIFQKV
jgi:DNA modification methylase